MSTIQPSSLLPTLLDGIDEEQLLTVLHIGPAVPETVEFFCHYRCKLHFIDLFSELDHLQVEDDDASGAQAALTGLLQLPADTRTSENGSSSSSRHRARASQAALRACRG